MSSYRFREFGECGFAAELSFKNGNGSWRETVYFYRKKTYFFYYLPDWASKGRNDPQPNPTKPVKLGETQ